MDVRTRLLDAALRVYQQSGSRGATTRRIAREAGVNEVTLFRHFGSKAALISEALDAAARQNLAQGLPEEPADPERELREWCRTRLEHLLRSRSMIRSCMGEMEQTPEAAGFFCSGPRQVGGELRAYVGRLRERGMVSADFDTEVAVGMLMGALFSDAMGRDLMPERFSFSVEEAPERYVRFFLQAIGARPAPAERARRAAGM